MYGIYSSTSISQYKLFSRSYLEFLIKKSKLKKSDFFRETASKCRLKLNTICSSLVVFAFPLKDRIYCLYSNKYGIQSCQSKVKLATVLPTCTLVVLNINPKFKTKLLAKQYFKFAKISALHTEFVVLSWTFKMW